MKKFIKTEIKIDVYGEVYSLSKPSYKTAVDFGNKSEKKDDAEMAKLALEFLDAHGLPAKVTSEMEVEHVLDLMGLLMPSKKK